MEGLRNLSKNIVGDDIEALGCQNAIDLDIDGWKMAFSIENGPLFGLNRQETTANGWFSGRISRRFPARWIRPSWKRAWTAYRAWSSETRL